MKPELLAPAGDIEKAKIALIYGADAIYIGGTKFSLRARASNFTIPNIKEIVEFAHKLNKKVYITCNIIPRNENLDGLEEYLKELKDASVDAVIVSHPLIMVKANEVGLEVHISTQASVSNIEAINFYKRLNAKRIVLARELTLSEIKHIKDNTDLPLEVFIHGGMCSAISGRCTLSNHMADRDANRGGCAHSCRWYYKLYANDKLKYKSIDFQIASRDLDLVPYIKDLMDIGVESLKIEGRMKSSYYIATVVSAYRRLIDDIESGKYLNFDEYEKEIKKAENRITSIGFIRERAKETEQIYNVHKERPTKEFVGLVLGFDDKTMIAKIEQRNYFKIKDEIEVLSPLIPNRTFKIKEMYDDKMIKLDVARHPQQIIYIKVPFEVKKDDFLRLKKASKN